LPSGLPTKTLETHLPSPMRTTCPAHLILLDLITLTMNILLRIRAMKFIFIYVDNSFRLSTLVF
jgi:hypothetical protein